MTDVATCYMFSVATCYMFSVTLHFIDVAGSMHIDL